MTELDNLHEHLENMPIPVDDDWYRTTQHAVKKYNAKRRTKMVKFHEKMKAKVRNWKTNRSAEEISE